jgi:hypothetical protein
VRASPAAERSVSAAMRSPATCVRSRTCAPGQLGRQRAEERSERTLVALERGALDVQARRVPLAETRRRQSGRTLGLARQHEHDVARRLAQDLAHGEAAHERRDLAHELEEVRGPAQRAQRNSSSTL